MGERWRRWALVGLVVALVVALALAGCKEDKPFGAAGISGRSYESLIVRKRLEGRGLNRFIVPTAVATATPGFVIDNEGVGVSLEIRDSGTPVVQFSNDGGLAQTGDMAITGELQVAQPTAATTATPAVLINSSAAGSALLEVRDSATPVVQIANGGAFDANSTGDFADTLTLSKGSGNALVISAGGTISLPTTSDLDASGYVAIGNGTPDGAVTAGNDEELYVEGEAEFDAEVEFDGVIDADSTADIADTLTLSKGSGNALVVSSGGSVSVASGDVTVSGDSTNGNAGTRNEFVGLPRIRMKGLDQGTNGAVGGKTVDLDDDTPSGEFVATDADVVCSDDSTYYQEGSNSLQAAFSTDADAGDGCHDAVAALDFSDDESLGFWFYADTTLTAGDVIVDLTDDGGAQTIDLPAYATADTWVWVELSLPGANADKDSISDISFELSAAGAAVAGASAFNVYIDAVYKWDATEEEALGAAILDHGVLGVVDTENGDDLVMYTEYFVHYESGNDFIVWITDESASDIVVLYAY